MDGWPLHMNENLGMIFNGCIGLHALWRAGGTQSSLLAYLPCCDALSGTPRFQL